MKLNAIRIKFVDHPNPLILRFHGKGSYSQKLMVSSAFNEDQFHQVESAIYYCFQQKQSQNFSEVAIHLSDSSGHAWILERTPARIRIVRDSQLITSDEARTLLIAALLDRDVYESQLPQQMIASFDLDLKAKKNILNYYDPAREGANSPTPHRSWILEQKHNYFAKLCEELALNSKLGAESLVLFCNRLEPLYYQILGEQKNYHEFLSQRGEHSAVDISYLEKLRHEVEIITEIKESAGPLLQPGSHPNLVREKLNQLEYRLAELKANTSGEGIHFGKANVQWEDLFKTRADYQASENILNYSKILYQKASSSLDPVYNEYAKIVGSILETDKQITSELQEALNAISSELEQVQAKPAAKEESKWSDKIQKFFKPESIKVESSENELSESQKCAERLRVIQQSIDRALTSLGELHSDIACSREDRDAIHNQLTTLLEASKAEYQKAEQAWQGLARNSGVSQELTLDQLCLLARNIGLIYKLQAEKDDLLKLSFEAKQRFAKLEELINKWRVFTGSHKAGESIPHSMLIQEAQSIVRYLAEKSEQLVKLDSQRDKIKNNSYVKQQFELKIAELRRNWATEFKNISLPLLLENKKHWPEIFTSGRKLQTLIEMESHFSEENGFVNIFGAEVQKFPIVVIKDLNQTSSASDRLRLVEQIEKSKPQSLFLLFTADKILADTLHKMGCGDISRNDYVSSVSGDVENKNKRLSSMSSSGEKMNSSSVQARENAMSEKAQNTLAILQGRTKQKNI